MTPNGPGSAPVTGSTTGVPTWWLVDVDSRVVAGPFATRVDAALAEFSSAGSSTVSSTGDSSLDDLLRPVPAHGVRRDDGTLAARFSADDRVWLAHLSEQLDRLADDWDALIDDADPLTGLVCEVAAAVAEAGLPLHDCAGRTASPQLGGVCLTPCPGEHGVIVTWTQHDRMTLAQVRGGEADRAAQAAMNRAVGEVLSAFGFLVEPFGSAEAHVVRAADHPTIWD